MCVPQVLRVAPPWPWGVTPRRSLGLWGPGPFEVWQWGCWLWARGTPPTPPAAHPHPGWTVGWSWSSTLLF